MIAIILLEQAPRLTADALVEQLKKLSPPATGKIDVTAKDGTFLVTLGAHALTALVMDTPVPAGTLDRALDGNMTWPEATSTLDRHRHHIVVGSLSRRTDGVDKAARIAAAAALTAVTAALVRLTQCLGVYWAASETAVETAHFAAEAAVAASGERAPDFWTRLYLFRGADIGGRTPVGCATRGLADLVGREIEFEPAVLNPTVVAQRVLGAAHLLLFGAKEIKDGDTIGVSASERIRAQYAAKGKRVAAPVVALRYEIGR